ncbi:MAG: hypothetical protein H8D24_05425 [Gammaproteobacteria bacterium]|uniref:Uncharacterized protein n=1 Tax=Candidatus Thiopontia autotrophica TaxID=2841688 RepID=A0A8J6TSN7_9GAMM|nr:hypothetical protein [Candidatus Thiopontia autotrophica]
MEQLKEFSLVEMAICTACGTAIGLSAVMMLFFVAISLFSGTTVSAIETFMLG